MAEELSKLENNDFEIHENQIQNLIKIYKNEIDPLNNTESGEETETMEENEYNAENKIGKNREMCMEMEGDNDIIHEIIPIEINEKNTQTVKKETEELDVTERDYSTGETAETVGCSNDIQLLNPVNPNMIMTFNLDKNGYLQPRAKRLNFKEKYSTKELDHIIVNVEENRERLKSLKIIVEKTPSMRGGYVRYRSLKKKLSVSESKRDDIANAGFFYLRDGHVQCHECGLILYEIEEKDKISKIHFEEAINLVGGCRWATIQYKVSNFFADACLPLSKYNWQSGGWL